MTQPIEPATPRAKELIAIFAVAVLLRLVALGAMGVKQPPMWDIPWRSDGGAYIANAERINGGPMPKPYDQRVFVGLPWAIAMGHRVGLSYGWGSQGMCLAFSGLLCVLSASWLKDSRIGWAMAVLPPHWILDSSAVMNESLMLCLCVGALWLVNLRSLPLWGRLGGGGEHLSAFDCRLTLPAPNRPPPEGEEQESPFAWAAIIAAAALFGAAGIVRPMACFAVAGGAALLMQRKRTAQSLALLVASAAVVVLLVLAFKAAYWNPLDNAHVYQSDPSAYNGETLTWPFHSFIEVARAHGILHLNYLYKSLYMIVGIAIALIAIRQWRRSKTPLDAMAATWWTLNLAFATCIGSHWGVDIAQRSLTWAAPAGFYICRGWLPTTWYWRVAWALLPAPFVFITSQG